MNGGVGGLAARAHRLHEAAAAARARARRLGAQSDSMHWEGVAARRFRAELGMDLAEVLSLAVAAERAAQALERQAARLAIELAGVAS